MLDYVEHAIAPDNQDRDDAEWRFITHSWLKAPKSCVNSYKFSAGPASRYKYYCQHAGGIMEASTVLEITEFLGCSDAVVSRLKAGERRFYFSRAQGSCYIWRVLIVKAEMASGQ